MPSNVLITGCSTGIGFCAAKILHQRGYNVIAAIRKAGDATSLQEFGITTIVLDLDDSHSIQQAFNFSLDRFKGQIDALFNNAAYGQPGAVEDLTRDVLRQQFETNIFGTQELSNLVIAQMRKQGNGRIIYNSSVLGLVSMSFRGAYNASKFALEGLVDTLRLELYGSNIHISLIEPGPILSDFRKNSFKKYQQNINRDQSVHKDTYLAMEQRLTKQGAAVPFTLPAEAVVNKLIHALESKRPKIRYYVTFPTYLFAFLKRILPHRWLDYIIMKIQ
ncbi:MAG: SDR family NAD(P)-dependent oxidoreductase [Methylophaga sp.]|nr:SDR family NAD(P)-dependent oxidoreductase [Methylophaga sp.]